MKRANSPLYDLRMEYERANQIDVEALNRDVNSYLEKEPAPSTTKLALLGGIYFMVGENIEREAIKQRTRAEWAELERQYVHKSSFTLPDLVDNLLTRLERGKITREQYSAERKKFKPCEHRFCLDYFIPRRKDQKFCSNDCRKREHESLANFKKAGTYLPPSAYSEARQAEKDDAYFKHERLFEPKTLLEIGAKAETYKGYRDRETEERRSRASSIEKEAKLYEKVVGICRESVQETTLNIGMGKEAR
ncbi:hypothetical protein [Cytobacillus horneckiae]|uniref:Uncharacterized protein n=1 Tax=Cytobacillus horneckiae TaxID=549687 RepID=A0A2N0ZEA8_9BACI|nr:hypothetical protein [Cytobacillus horneckiae]MEC1157566.1 hypothetical protein [Cytobacillus horneckiae]MED2939514.1 hypothetical protein [Cytobacillus horneckiae]PKG27844.1 hypothetical protein CWS20_17290 [Cytobacillus horneckiae]